MLTRHGTSPMSTSPEPADVGHSQITITDSAEAWKFDDVDVDGTFQHTVVIAKSGSAYYYATVPYRLRDCQIDKVSPHLKVIPADDIFPLFPPGFTKAPLSITDEVFYKQPRLLHYGEQKNHAAKAILREATIYEKLQQYPHPNVGQYWGCAVAEGRITSLVLNKYRETLEQRTRRPMSLDLVNRWMEGISSGISHLHGLGYVHNDLNPYNIMIDASDTAIVLDYDACCANGAAMIKDGTPGWSSENDGLSSWANDIVAITKLRQYVLSRLT